MKTFNCFNSLIAGLVLTALAAGCSSTKPGITKFGSHNPGTEGQNGPGPGGSIPGVGGDATSGGGIPQGPGHVGWTEDASTLKADTVYFDFDSAVVKPEAKSNVDAVADYLKSNSAAALKIEGHCDERGTEEYNRALGDRRAQALREAIVADGIDATRIDTLSYGKDRPAVQGHDEAAWSKNRRGEFIVLTSPK